MDIAQNFGVPYNIDDPYGSYSQLDLKHVGDKMTRLHSGVAELRAQADYNAQGMESLKHDRRRMWTDRDDELLNAFLSISRSAERLEERINRRGVSFNQQDQMPEKERSILLTKIIDEMAGWQDSMTQIQSNLARQSRRV